MRSVVTTKLAGLVAITLSCLLNTTIVSSVNVALPAIQSEFRMNSTLLGWVPMALLLSSSMILVPCGRIADIYGRKRIFTWGVTIFTSASLLCGTANSAGSLIVFRFLQGIGSAMFFATASAIIIAVYAPEERGKALGIMISAVYVGLSLGPFLGGFLTTRFGWRSIFLTIFPLGLVIISVVRLYLKEEWAEAKGEKFDLVGSIIYAASLFLLMYGFSLLPNLIGFCLTLTGVLGIVFFVAWEHQTKMPVLDIGLLRGNTTFVLSNLAALIHYCAAFGATFLLSLYLQYTQSRSPEQAGAILVCLPIVQVVLAPIVGRMSDRVNPRLLSSIGMGLTALGLLFFAFLGERTPLYLIISNSALLGFSSALFISPNTNSIMSSIDKKFYGVAAGTHSTTRLVGQMIGMGFIVFMFNYYLGRAQITPALYPLFLKATKVLFALFAVICAAGLFALMLPRGNKECTKEAD
jgi:EmrB/QacA subfamily drug resistance transporter